MLIQQLCVKICSQDPREKLEPPSPHPHLTGSVKHGPMPQTMPQVKMGEMEGHYEVSIRTPVTPPRWKEFDAELAAVWEGLLDALVSGDRPAVAVAVLTFVYYWYNFMPLARGTAVCGHVTLLSLFAVAGMPLTAAIPVVSPPCPPLHIGNAPLYWSWSLAGMW